MSETFRSASTHGQPSGVSPRIYIDLTDVVAHAIWHPTCAGIPRVQLEVAAALVRSNANVVPFSLYGDIWRDLRTLVQEADGDGEQLLLRLREIWPFPGVRPSWRNPRRTLRLAKARLRMLRDRLCSRVPQLNAADTVFVGGAFWMSRSVIDLCKRAAVQNARLIVLVHDLIPFTDPQYTGHDFKSEYRTVLALPAHFIVTTDFNRRTLEAARKEIGVYDRTLVSVVNLAHEFPGAERNETSPPAPPRFVGLAKVDFVLCVGTVEIRKNHMMLFSVWDELTAELGDRLPLLVVAGRRGWKSEAALQRLDAGLGHGRIVFFESPSDEELRWLYAACLFTIFPSFVEGWGLPVGESLWFGKPCAASNTTSIPVVGRDLCLYFSPYHATPIKDAIHGLLDPDLRRCYRTKIAAASLRTWAEVAADIERVILQAVPVEAGQQNA